MVNAHVGHGDWTCGSFSGGAKGVLSVRLEFVIHVDMWTSQTTGRTVCTRVSSLDDIN